VIGYVVVVGNVIYGERKGSRSNRRMVIELEDIEPVKLGLENTMRLLDGEWFVHGLEMIRVEMATYQLGLASHAPQSTQSDYRVVSQLSVLGKSDPQTEPVVEQVFFIATTRLKADFEQQYHHTDGMWSITMSHGGLELYLWFVHLTGAAENSQRVISEPNVADTSLNQNSINTWLHPNTEK
ncbi:hypothetical protein Tco_1222660, partial [Tanacetum coccineum]